MILAIKTVAYAGLFSFNQKRRYKAKRRELKYKKETDFGFRCPVFNHALLRLELSNRQAADKFRRYNY